eukprot:SAG31_NODE_385_length_16413_cov_265.286686_3_plen_639_part_00
MEHPSISRQHAVIQHGDVGRIFLFELGSTHGTFVNKRQVRPLRHEELQIGDVIRFGLSTRLFILQGPEALRKQVLRDTMSPQEVQKMKFEQLQAKKNALKHQKDASAIVNEADTTSVCMWGDMEDACAADEVESTSEHEQPASSLSSFGRYQRNESAWAIENEAAAAETRRESMSAREIEVLDKIEKRLSKVTNMQTEKERILAKEIEGDLTEGQRAQIDRNAKQTAKLEDEIEDLREQLDEVRRTQARQRGDAPPPATSRRGRRQQANQSVDSDDDDFYDRAAKPKKNGSNPNVGTRGSKPTLKELQADRERLIAEQQRVEALLVTSTASRRSDSAAEHSAQAPTIDPLDQFMQDNSVSMKLQRRQELEKERKNIVAELHRIDGLLAFARPAYLRLPTADTESTPLHGDSRKKLAANFCRGSLELQQDRKIICDPISNSSAAAVQVQRAGTVAATITAARNAGSIESNTDAETGLQSNSHDTYRAVPSESKPTKSATVCRTESDKSGDAATVAKSEHLPNPKPACSSATDVSDVGKRKNGFIDGARGGLQLVGKRHKNDLAKVSSSRSRYDFHDPTDALDSYGQNDAMHAWNGGFAPTSQAEENELIAQDAAAMDNWEPPSQDSQSKLADLAKRLGY